MMRRLFSGFALPQSWRLRASRLMSEAPSTKGGQSTSGSLHRLTAKDRTGFGTRYQQDVPGPQTYLSDTLPDSWVPRLPGDLLCLVLSGECRQPWSVRTGFGLAG